MEDLLPDFREIDLAAIQAAEHPILGPDENVQFSLSVSTSHNTMESICNLRWPDAAHEEKAIMEQRMKRYISWDELKDKTDALTELWQAENKQHAECAIRMFEPPPEPATRRHRAHRPIDPALVCSLAIGPLFAAVLVSGTSEEYGSAGTVWKFPTVYFDDFKDTHWTPVKGAQLKHCQVSYIVQSILYVIDGPMLRVFDLNVGEVFSTDLYAQCKIPEHIRVGSLRVNQAGVVLFMCEPVGLVFLGYLNSGDKTFTFLSSFVCTLGPTPAKFSSIGLMPNSGQYHELMLGRTDGLIERWILQLGEDKVQLDQDGTLDLFRPQISSQSGKEIPVVAGVPVRGVYVRGRRLQPYTDQNRLILTDLSSVPQIYLIEKPNEPIVDVHVFGDMTAVLQANGVLRTATYVSSADSQVVAAKHLVLPPEHYIPAGQQRVAMLPDFAVALSKNGLLCAITLHKI